jgi:WD40 repeat protein
LAKESNIETHVQTLVLAPHPTDEEILVTGSGKGKVFLWNIEQRRVLREFNEYDNYSLSNYTFNDAIDGQFSPDGNALIIGSTYGSLSLFSFGDSDDAYELTPVQQFMQLEDTACEEDPY